MAKQRASTQKRDREFRKRERERRKKEKAALKRARRESGSDEGPTVVPPLDLSEDAPTTAEAESTETREAERAE